MTPSHHTTHTPQNESEAKNSAHHLSSTSIPSCARTVSAWRTVGSTSKHPCRCSCSIPSCSFVLRVAVLFLARIRWHPSSLHAERRTRCTGWSLCERWEEWWGCGWWTNAPSPSEQKVARAVIESNAESTMCSIGWWAFGRAKESLVVREHAFFFQKI